MRTLSKIIKNGPKKYCDQGLLSSSLEFFNIYKCLKHSFPLPKKEIMTYKTDYAKATQDEIAAQVLAFQKVSVLH